MNGQLFQLNDICSLLDLPLVLSGDTAAALFHCTLVMDLSKQAESVLQFDVFSGQFHSYLVYGSPSKLQVNLMAEYSISSNVTSLKLELVLQIELSQTAMQNLKCKPTVLKWLCRTC